MIALPVEWSTVLSALFRRQKGGFDHDSTDLRLAALPTAVGTARRLTLAQLTTWGLGHLADTCTLVVSELVTNGIAATGTLVAPSGYAELHDHTPATIIVRLRRTTTHLIAEVWDGSDEQPVRAEAADTAECGRGLILVNALTTAWGCYPSPMGGKVVWGCWELPKRLP